MRVLFVDDEPRVLEALERMLGGAVGSWEIATATSGGEALGLLALSRFDVIVTDMRMPGMDGAQLLAQVQERWPAMTRIVLSGQTEHEHSLQTLGNAHQFVSKPCSATVLAEVVENAFCRRALTPKSHVRDLASTVHRLPSPPRLHEQLLSAIALPDVTTDDLVDLVRQDHGLSASIVRIASVVARTSPGVAALPIHGDVRGAMMQLGLEPLRALILTERVACKVSVRRVEEIQSTALDVARVTRLILPPEEQAAGLTAALLCDVGTLVLEHGAPDEMAAVYAAAVEGGLAIDRAEKEFLGSNHADVGGYILGLWGVPTRIVDAVLRHHDLGREASFLSAAVHVAQRIVAGEAVSPEAAERAGVPAQVKAIALRYRSEAEAS